jgi:hypothetical protein
MTDTIVYQWLIYNKHIDKFRLTYNRYSSEDEVRDKEVVSLTEVVMPLEVSRSNMPRQQLDLIKYPADFEYSRQIKHSGGFDGHDSC